MTPESQTLPFTTSISKSNSVSVCEDGPALHHRRLSYRKHMQHIFRTDDVVDSPNDDVVVIPKQQLSSSFDTPPHMRSVSKCSLKTMSAAHRHLLRVDDVVDSPNNDVARSVSKCSIKTMSAAHRHLLQCYRRKTKTSVSPNYVFTPRKTTTSSVNPNDVFTTHAGVWKYVDIFHTSLASYNIYNL